MQYTPTQTTEKLQEKFTSVGVLGTEQNQEPQICTNSPGLSALTVCEGDVLFYNLHHSYAADSQH